MLTYIKMSSFEGKNFPHPQHSKKLVFFLYKTSKHTF